METCFRFLGSCLGFQYFLSSGELLGLVTSLAPMNLAGVVVHLRIALNLDVFTTNVMVMCKPAVLVCRMRLGTTRRAE